MNTRLTAYTDYKETGLAWLGLIPSHWSITRLKYILNEMDARSQTGSESLLRVSQYSGVTPRSLATPMESRALSLVGYKVVRKADLAVNIMLAWNGSMGVSKYDGIVSPAYCVYRFSSNFLPAYYHQLLRLDSYKWRIKISSTGVVESRLRLYTDGLFAIEALAPPREEQEAIARFVEHIDRQLSRVIRAKRRLIELLNEQKQALIHRAVTRGLDPDAPRKPSGVEWLGEIPAHWQLLKIKYATRLKSGDSITAFEISEEGAYPVFGGNGLRGYTENYTHDGDFVLIGRQGALCGNINYARGRFWASEHAVVATPIQNLSLLYYGELLKIMNLNQYSFAAAQPGLSVERIQNLVTPFPPYEEQCMIADYINRESEIIGRAEQRAKKEIELIREYRARLIADVVTGKLDVREAAKNLPADVFPGSEAANEYDETDEAEISDTEGEVDTDAGTDHE